MADREDRLARPEEGLHELDEARVGSQAVRRTAARDQERFELIGLRLVDRQLRLGLGLPLLAGDLLSGLFTDHDPLVAGPGELFLGLLALGVLLAVR